MSPTVLPEREDEAAAREEKDKCSRPTSPPARLARRACSPPTWSKRDPTPAIRTVV